MSRAARSGVASLPVLQLFQFLPQGGQARDRRAVRLVSGRLFLHLRPSRGGILSIPGTPGFWIKCALRDQIVERATIIFQIEDAIARIKIEIGAVQFVAMRQAGGKVSLRDFCLPNFCLEIVKLGEILR